MKCYKITLSRKYLDKLNKLFNFHFDIINVGKEQVEINYLIHLCILYLYKLTKLQYIKITK